MRPSINPVTDPFGERAAPLQRRSLHLLGALVRFESNSARLLRLVDHAFAGLPRHRLWAQTPRLRVRLQLSAGRRRPSTSQPPPLTTFAGPGLLGGAIDQSNLAVISPAQGSALILVSRDMLRHAYEVRYELIEFALYVLVARAQGLVPLHAAVVGRHGRGLLLVGDSGAGKTTMALHCLLQGLEIVSEDGVFVLPDELLATGNASFLHLHRGGLRLLNGHKIAGWIRSSPIIRRRGGAHKYEVDLRRTGYRLARSAMTIQAVVFLSKRRASKRQLLVPVAARHTAARLAVLQPYGASQLGWRRLTKNLADVRAFELRRGSDPGLAVEALRELLDLSGRYARRA
jgi:hypothetical protein